MELRFYGVSHKSIVPRENKVLPKQTTGDLNPSKLALRAVPAIRGNLLPLNLSLTSNDLMSRSLSSSVSFQLESFPTFLAKEETGSCRSPDTTCFSSRREKKTRVGDLTWSLSRKCTCLWPPRSQRCTDRQSNLVRSLSAGFYSRGKHIFFSSIASVARRPGTCLSLFISLSVMLFVCC